jgi:putative flavoprotein involved in K+ transport
MAEHVDVVVIGGGQAGLATSHELAGAGVEHVVLEMGKVGQSWRGRWDSFCLVTPNWTMRLPGHPYDGHDPDGYLPRDEIVAHLERYARGFDAPVREGVDVSALRPVSGGFALETSAGDLRAIAVVVATGAYQRPTRPAAAAGLPADLLRLDGDDYRNPGSVPSGPVLVVGSGQSGCQIAEELLQAGREVFLSCGRAPWVPRRLGRHDAVWWATETGYLEQTVESLPVPEARLAANLQGTGRDGGHDLNYRTLRAAGVTLLGRFLGAERRRARFADDLGASVAWGDERYRQFADLVRGLVAERGLPNPDLLEPEPFDAASSLEELDLSGFGAVVFALGYRPRYDEWVHVEGAFDPLGFPLHVEGESAAAPGLFFVGVHFLRKRKSSLLYGVGEDAAIVASGVASRLAGGAG